jgi:hypothetical protein
MDEAAITRVTEYHAKHARIKLRYGRHIDFSRESLKSIPMDIIEAEEDLREILPLLSAITSATLPEAELNSAITAMCGRLWHTIDHLTSLDQGLKEFLSE